MERARQKREEKEEAPGTSSEGEGFGEEAAVAVASTGKSFSELPTQTDPVPMSLDEHFKQEIENANQKIKADEEKLDKGERDPEDLVNDPEGKVGRGSLDKRKRMMQQKVKAQLGALLPHASDADLERLVRRFGPDEIYNKVPLPPQDQGYSNLQINFKQKKLVYLNTADSLVSTYLGMPTSSPMMTAVGPCVELELPDAEPVKYWYNPPTANPLQHFGLTGENPAWSLKSEKEKKKAERDGHEQKEDNVVYMAPKCTVAHFNFEFPNKEGELQSIDVPVKFWRLEVEL